MSLTQYIRCDRCGTELTERGARASCRVQMGDSIYLTKIIVEGEHRSLTDLCEMCMALVLVAIKAAI